MALKPVKKKIVSKKEKVETTTQKFTDLRQVLDYTRPFTIFFSGVEYETYLDILYSMGIRNFLMSYEYLKGKGHGQLKKYPDMHLFIDSGAYTYMNDPKYAEYSVEQWEEQIREYLVWAKRHKDSIFAICELDLQYLVGNEQVYEWRKKYFEPFMLETGIPVCFMYHEEGMQQWEYMCKRYPYVGMSLAVDNATEIQAMFRIAEKYNTLCQGMASTNTALLINYPFYTVDSTTWNVGLKFGEISVWTGTKMIRVKKHEFETKAFPFIAKYDYKFDFNLILAEDKTEMIKVNAYAFIQAETFVRDRLKSRMYWLKAKPITQDLDSVDEDFFPAPEWFDGAMQDYKEYAKRFNINPEYEDVLNTIMDVTVFLNWDNSSYEHLKDQYFKDDCKLLHELHDLYINRIVGSNEERIKDLQSFFRDCVEGKNDKLLQLGTNFDRIIKERDYYIEEDDTEVVDVSPEEIRKQLANILPSGEDPAPDISALDDEIFKDVGIIPVRDEKGKFLKGQKVVQKPKQVYSKKFPKFACDTCFAAAKCPEYKAGYVCAYHKLFGRFDSRDMGDVIQAIQGIINHNMVRMQRAMVMEVINGVIDPNVTSLMDMNVKYMTLIKQLYESSSPEVLRHTRVIKADGTQEETMTVSTNPQSGGILEKLFMGTLNRPKASEPPDDIVEGEVINKKEE